MRRPHGRRGHPRASPHPCGGARTVGAAWGDEAAPPWPRPPAHTPLCNASSPRSLPSRLRTLQGIFPLADVLRPRLSQLLCVRQFHDNTSCFLKVAVAGPSLTLAGPSIALAGPPVTLGGPSVTLALRASSGPCAAPGGPVLSRQPGLLGRLWELPGFYYYAP